MLVYALNQTKYSLRHWENDDENIRKCLELRRTRHFAALSLGVRVRHSSGHSSARSSSPLVVIRPRGLDVVAVLLRSDDEEHVPPREDRERHQSGEPLQVEHRRRRGDDGCARQHDGPRLTPRGLAAPHGHLPGAGFAEQLGDFGWDVGVIRVCAPRVVVLAIGVLTARRAGRHAGAPVFERSAWPSRAFPRKGGGALASPRETLRRAPPRARLRANRDRAASRDARRRPHRFRRRAEREGECVGTSSGCRLFDEQVFGRAVSLFRKKAKIGNVCWPNVVYRKEHNLRTGGTFDTFTDKTRSPTSSSCSSCPRRTRARPCPPARPRPKDAARTPRRTGPPVSKFR